MLDFMDGEARFMDCFAKIPSVESVCITVSSRAIPQLHSSIASFLHVILSAAVLQFTRQIFRSL
jgi:hypothetical protein